MIPDVRIVPWFLCVGACHPLLLDSLPLTAFSARLGLLGTRLLVVSVVGDIGEDIPTMATLTLLSSHVLLHLAVLLVVLPALAWLCRVLHSVARVLLPSWLSEATRLISVTTTVPVALS